MLNYTDRVVVGPLVVGDMVEFILHFLFPLASCNLGHQSHNMIVGARMQDQDLISHKQ